LFLLKGAEAPCMTILAENELARVIPLRRTVPCASGTIFGIAVEIHLGGSVGRAALALHELHDLAERELEESGDAMLAVVEAADGLLDRMIAERLDDVSIAVGVALSPVGRAAIQIKPRNQTEVQPQRFETTVLVHRSHLRLAMSTTSKGEGMPIATLSRPSASASLRGARLALNGQTATDSFGLDSFGPDALVIDGDGTLHQLVV
jgi:hypothetical protein